MKILHLISSPRKEGSFSIKLGNGIVKQLQEKHPGSTVITHNLAESSFPHLEELQMTSFFTPQEARSEVLVEAVKHSDASIAELMDADVVVIGVPMYNFSIHSSLKAWIDHVVRAGVTFSYGAEGAKGLVTGKKAYLAMASGAVFSDGPMSTFDFAEPYLRHMLSFIGITDITTYRVEGLSMPGLKEVALEKAMEGIAV